MLDRFSFLPRNKVYDGMKENRSKFLVISNPHTTCLHMSMVLMYYRKSGKSMQNITYTKNIVISVRNLKCSWRYENCQHRTNNICESLNNRLTHLVGPYPTVRKLIYKMREELGWELDEGIPAWKIWTFGNTGERLWNLCCRVANNEISVE